MSCGVENPLDERILKLRSTKGLATRWYRHSRLAQSRQGCPQAGELRRTSMVCGISITKARGNLSGKDRQHNQWRNALALDSGHSWLRKSGEMGSHCGLIRLNTTPTRAED